MIDIWNEAEKTAETRETKHRVFLHIRPVEVSSLMELHDVDEDERAEVWFKLKELEKAANEIRPAKPKPKPGRRGVRR